MKVTVLYGEKAAEFDIDHNEKIEDVKAIAEVEFGVPYNELILVYGGKQMEDHRTIDHYGVQESDMILVERKRQAPARTTQPAATVGRQSGASAGAGRQQMLNIKSMSDEDIKALEWADLSGDMPPDDLHRVFKVNRNLLNQIQHSNPQLYEAFDENDPSKLRMYLMKRAMDKSQTMLKEAELRQRLGNDPMDVEAQRALENTIHQRNIDANLEFAHEHMPEAFAQVPMLYINVEVNETPLKAFVDSGAQTTIMSKNCAERCGIWRLVDTRFSGTAAGVGTAKIIGQVHMAQLKIGNTYFPCKFTVLDQNSVDMLFGLDMLKRHQCVIDLKNHCLNLEGANGTECVSFLPENEIPKDNFPRSPAAVGGSDRTAPSATTATGEVSASSRSGQGSSSQAQQQQHAVDPSKLEQLVSFGFSRQESAEALVVCQGNVEMAASYLFQNSRSQGQ